MKGVKSSEAGTMRPGGRDAARLPCEQSSP